MKVEQNLENQNPSHQEVFENKSSNDLIQYCGNWIWRAVECLVESPEFEYSPKWSAKRLNVTVDKIVDAFEGLERLGYIKRDQLSFKKVIPEYHINQKTFSRDELLATHSRLAPQIISQLQASSKFTTYFMLGNDELVSKYTPEIMKIYRQMHKEGLEKGLTQVIASEISFAKLSDNNVESSGGLQ